MQASEGVGEREGVEDVEGYWSREGRPLAVESDVNEGYRRA